MLFTPSVKPLLLLAALFLLAFSVPAAACPEMPGQAVEGRFTAMDADADGKISREEFFTAQPQLKEGAFTAINTDRDGFISLEEWKAFLASHAMGTEKSGMAGPVKGGAAASSRGALHPAPARNSTGPTVRETPGR